MPLHALVVREPNLGESRRLRPKRNATRPVQHTAERSASPRRCPQPEDRYRRPAEVTGQLPREIILYQYDVCPFCCKVKAFLDYHKVCVDMHGWVGGWGWVGWRGFWKGPVSRQPCQAEPSKGASALVAWRNTKAGLQAGSRQQPVMLRRSDRALGCCCWATDAARAPSLACSHRDAPPAPPTPFPLFHVPRWQIPYRCVEVNPLTKAELKWSEYRKVRHPLRRHCVAGHGTGWATPGQARAGSELGTACYGLYSGPAPPSILRAQSYLCVHTACPTTLAACIQCARRGCKFPPSCCRRHPQVPVVLVDGEQVNDSSAIISRLAAEVEAAGRQGGSGRSSSSNGGSGGKKAGFLSGLFGSGGSSSEGSARAASGSALGGESAAEEEKWRRWVDDWFVKVGGPEGWVG